MIARPCSILHSKLLEPSILSSDISLSEESKDSGHRLISQGMIFVAVQPETNRSIKIQVKPRAATDAGGFKVKNWDFDVLVLARLNLGRRDELIASTGREEPEPDYFVVLRDDVPELEAKGEIKFRTSALPDGYRDNWNCVRRLLEDCVPLERDVPHR